LSLFQANLLVAMRAGYLARKNDGPPGAKVLADGLIILGALVEDRRLSANHPTNPRRKRPREPT
jgi:hypothetical protein